MLWTVKLLESMFTQINKYLCILYITSTWSWLYLLCRWLRSGRMVALLWRQEMRISIQPMREGSRWAGLSANDWGVISIPRWAGLSANDWGVISYSSWAALIIFEGQCLQKVGWAINTRLKDFDLRFIWKPKGHFHTIVRYNQVWSYIKSTSFKQSTQPYLIYGWTIEK